MPVELNHTIVAARDKVSSAKDLAELLDLPAPTSFGPFEVVQVGATSLDFMTSDRDIHPQHYAFLVSEDEFDTIFARITGQGLQYWADPRGERPGEINHHDGGRGVYWQSPDGHYLEIITRPYGSGS
ncbi:MAG TPA: VOC family protein [Pseudonocardia sp.]|jgi:catechol 2,3-dioxygenase-like lactoylglutathione lyase family enzyme|nr:VOC family protein [Pseudonocardia sp.]